MSDLVHKIQMIRHTRVIKDPFPEHSSHQSLVEFVNSNLTLWQKVFGKHLPPPPPPVNIHAAYQMGYDKAYNEIISELK